MEIKPTTRVHATSTISCSIIPTRHFRSCLAAPTTPPLPARPRSSATAAETISRSRLSTTQLSANWDMATDNESGIKGYQYAIGTTQGGTNVVNWTTMKNILGVTKTGLSLTTGQTYYFSVKAINGVGLTSTTATNSNGQTVGTDTTAPSAPAAVRDGGDVNYSPPISMKRNPPTNCTATGIQPPITKAASATTSMPLAPRREAPTPPIGRL